MHTLLAAGAVDLSGVTSIVQGLSDDLFKLGAPLAVIGIIIGGIATWMGYQHGPHTLRNSIVALVIVGLAKIISTAVFAAG
jgi:TrbC/VIRB2 pilin